MRVAFFGPYLGEFGWELYWWNPYCRAIAKQEKFGKVYACSFGGMQPLYEDFADEFVPHGFGQRLLKCAEADGLRYWEHVDVKLPDDVTDHIYPKKRGTKQPAAYHLFGQGAATIRRVDILIHAAWHPAEIKRYKNYPLDSWNEIVSSLLKLTPSIASIGMKTDLHIERTADWRGMMLRPLMETIAAARLVVGGSSGVMHLAELCGTPIVTWIQKQPSMGISPEWRYRGKWNPFQVPVGLILDGDWRPKPGRVLAEVVKMLKGE